MLIVPRLYFHVSLSMRKKLFGFFLFLLAGSCMQAQPLYFPPLTGNAWDTLSAASLGWCQPQIDSLSDYLESRNTKAWIVLKDGKIVIERYYGTFTVDSSWYWASAGKSLTSVLTGIAQQEGFLDIQDSSSKYLGQGWTSATPVKEGLITIRNQLSMTTGLDDNVPDKDCTDDTCLLYLSDAGTRWAYHNAPYTLLDEVIQQATGSTLNAYLLQKLTLTTGLSGAFYPSGYNNVFVSKPRSMARFGLLALNHGNWNGQQILDTSYFNAMTNTSQPLNESYGYLWWLNGKSSFMLPGSQLVFNGPLTPSAPNDMFSAVGKNGQILNIVPSQNLVMLRMGDPPPGINALVPVFFNDTIWQKFNLVLCNTIAVEEINLQPSIYPNPAKELLNIELPGKEFEYSISSQNGKELWKGNGNNKIEFNLHLSAGLYLLKINYHADNPVYRKLLVIP